MTRAHGVLALLLAAALAWAYALTRTEWWPARGSNEPVALISVEPRDVLSLEYTEAGSKVVLKNDPAVPLTSGQPAVWIDAEGPAAVLEAPASRLPQSSPSTLTNAPGSAGPPLQSGAASSAPPERASFRGGLFAAAVLRDLAHLSAVRDLGRVDAQQLEAFGLAKSTATLRVERTGGEPLVLKLGNATLAGLTRYAQLQSGGRVYLVPQSTLRQLERPRRLMDREWLPFNLADARLIEAKLGGRTLSIWRLVNVPPTEPQRWSRKRDAASGDPAAQGWIQALAGVKVLDYLDQAAPPAGSETQLEVSVYLTEPASGAGAPPAPPSAPVVLRVFKPGKKAAAGQVSAVSGYTRMPVALSAPAVQAVLDRARSLLDSH